MVNWNVCRKEMEWGGRKLVLETGKIAKQATGAVYASYGDTVVVATVVAAKEAKADQDFFPLTVNYQEKYYATGKIPGGFMKREGKPSEHEVLVSRLIDRPIRPLFPDAFKTKFKSSAPPLLTTRKRIRTFWQWLRPQPHSPFPVFRSWGRLGLPKLATSTGSMF